MIITCPVTFQSIGRRLFLYHNNNNINNKISNSSSNSSSNDIFIITKNHNNNDSPCGSGGRARFVRMFVHLCPMPLSALSRPVHAGDASPKLMFMRLSVLSEPAVQESPSDKARLEPYFVQRCPGSYISEFYFVPALSTIFLIGFYFHTI